MTRLKCNERKEWLYAALLIACVALWSIQIWRFSAQPGTLSEQTSGGVTHTIVHLLMPAATAVQTDTVEHIVRKAAHMTEFALLGMLLFSAFHVLREPHRAFSAMTCALLSGAVDELHQLLVPGRSCMLTDVAIDGAGAAIGILILYALLGRSFRKQELRIVPRA